MINKLDLPSKEFSNVEIVTLAIYLLGGDLNYIDTEDIAIKSNEIAPGRFSWRKYPNQINIEVVRKRLSDAINPEKYGFLFGSVKKGWVLTKKGLEIARILRPLANEKRLSRIPMNKDESSRVRKEKEKMMRSDAFIKYSEGQKNNISIIEAESFFRLDDYVRGKARQERITRILNTFSNDAELAEVIKYLTNKVRDI